MQADAKAPDGRLPTVLIVDDDPTICRIYRTMLEKSGYRVKTAMTFQMAADLMAGHEFDALVSDIALGDKDGLDILAKSRQLHPTTPVILVTGRPDVDTAAAAVRLNAYEYLAKPVSLERLVSTVSRAVQLKSLHVEKIRSQNRFLTDVIDSLSHPFVVLDADDYSVKIANAAARKLQRNSAKTCFGMHHNRDRPCSQSGSDCPLEEVRRTRQPVHLVHKHQDADWQGGRA